jgi:uncharacterized protein YqgC (DUF456 family)
MSVVMTLSKIDTESILCFSRIDAQIQESCSLIDSLVPTHMLYAAAILLIVIGLLGTVLPALPGTPLVFVGFLLIAWADNFTHVSTGMMILLGILTAAAVLVDVVAGAVGAKRAGASPYAVLGAALGTILGVFTGFVGLLFLPFVGAVLGELFARQDLLQAGRAGIATWLGLVLGMAAKIAITFVMLGIFAAAYFF